MTLTVAEPFSAPVELPASLFQYRIERPIAEGGMGQVFLGHDSALERPVAVKIIKAEIAALPGFSDRFLQEARQQARISHSNVVQVYFAGEAQGVWFMAMELVDGGNLESFLDRKEKMAWGDAVRHWMGLAEGLREAARLGIVHRDIKPANILLDHFGLAHLADFGLALPVGLNAGPANSDPPGSLPPGSLPAGGSLPPVSQTADDSGFILGTPHYMSPEQARGDPLDTRADLYSLGATFYELLSGEPAIPARSIPEAQTFHRRTRPRPLRERAPQVPRALARIVDRCLSPRPEQRYASCDELLHDLRVAAPRTMVPARAPQRLLAWALDIGVAVEIARLTLQALPLLAFLVLAVWFCVGAVWLGASPGQWLVRAQLRTAEDLDVPPGRVALRFVLQHGWLLPVTLALTGVYDSDTSGMVSVFAAAGAGWLLLVALGTLPSLKADGLALHDRLTRTRVLLDTH